MKKTTLAIIAFTAAFLTSCLSSQTQNAGDAFLWKTEIRGNTVYLAGSMHLGKAEDYPLYPDYTKAFEESDILVMEIGEQVSPAAEIYFKALDKNFRLEDGKTLNDIMPAETIKNSISYLGEEGYNALVGYVPSVLAFELYMSGLALSGNYGKYAVDVYFSGLAAERKMKIVGLETIESQLNSLFSPEPLEMQIESVKQILVRMQIISDFADATCRAYYSNDFARLEKILLAGYGDNPVRNPGYIRLFLARNYKMAERLEEIISETKEPSTYFVLIGVGHLLGPKNVREILESRGHTVTKYFNVDSMPIIEGYNQTN